MTTATLSFSKAKARSISVNFFQINWKLVCLFGFLICLPLLVLYVWQVNNLTNSSYLIKTSGKEINQLLEENKNLQVSFAENSFLGQALEKIQAMNFQKVVSVKYIQIPDNSVAKK